jgi:hypothetical protein
VQTHLSYVSCPRMRSTSYFPLHFFSIRSDFDLRLTLAEERSEVR